MIFEQHLSFLDNFKVNVEVFSASGKSLGDGELKVSQKSAPQILFKDLTVQLDSKNKSVLTCKSDEHTYQLLDCEIYGHSIFPRFIIRGEKKRSKFKEVSILFQGLSQWFNQGNHIDITDEKVLKTRSTNQFKTELSYNDKKFHIYNEYWCDTERTNPSSHQINEYAIIKIKAKQSSFSIVELNYIINQVRIFFTLLLGHPIGINYILDKVSKYNSQSIYLCNLSRKTNENIDTMECFVRPKPLFNENRWSEILQGYFSNKNDRLRKVWGRTSGMLSYEGFWEYEVFAYVSLLDRYVTINAETDKLELSQNMFKKYKKIARDALKKIEKPASITDEIFTSMITSISDQVTSNIQNTSISSFDAKFDLKISQTDSSFLKVLKFTPEQFKHIKNMRNAIAHGDEPQTHDNQYLTYESAIKNKVAMLLRYWVFIDIGFTNQEFLNYLKNWLAPIVSNAYIDNTELDIALGDHHFLKVNKTNFARVKKLKSKPLVLTHIQSSNSYRVDFDAINRLSEWQLNLKKSRNRSGIDELISEVDTTKIKNAIYLNSVYIEHSDQLFKTHGVYILNCPKSIYEKKVFHNNLKFYDHISNNWLSTLL